MPEQISSMAAEHHDGDPMPPLHGTVEFVEYVTEDGEIFHLCRDVDGKLVLMIDDGVVTSLSEDVVRWMASNFVGALDDWPQRG